MSIDIQFNNVLGSTLGIYMKEKPSLPAAQEKIEQIQVPGRDGTLLVRNGVYEATQILIEFNYIGPQEKWGEIWRAAKQWLSASNAELRFTDDPDVYYRITHVTVSENTKRGNRIGNFSATFNTKDGLSYLEAGKEFLDVSESIVNPGIESKPIYMIKGTGMCTLEVNGETFTSSILENLTIDTEKMICYRSDGATQNCDVVGDYGKIVFVPGENFISVSEGFDCKIIPRWRCL